MEIGQIGQGVTPRQTENQTAQSVISSDFETFLKMLTTQMENQDPLNPIESSDYAVQLATFSGVEQQVKTNELLENLGGQMGMLGMSQIAGWVGMEARAAAPAQFDGSPIELYPNPAGTADQAILVVRNAQGQEVDRLAVPVSTAPLDWAGTNSAGQALAHGLYSFELESYVDGDLLQSDPVDVYSRITEARNENGATVLVLEGGVSIATDAVSALRSQ